MIVGTWIKQFYEVEPVTMDFTRRFGAGESILGATITSKNADTGASVAGLLVGSVVIDPTGFVSQFVQGGVPGTSYILEYKAVTTIGRQVEDEVGITVKET